MLGRSDTVDSNELAPLVRSHRTAGNRNHEPESGRNRLVSDAVYTLTPLLIVVAMELIIPLILLFINLFIGFVIPLWVSFMVVCIGHIIYGLLCYGAILNVFASVDPLQTSTTELIENLHTESTDYTLLIRDDSRIVLIKYILDSFTSAVFCYVMLLITQILVYLAAINVVAPVSFLIPIYIVIGMFLSTAFLCRSTHILQTMTLLCLLSTLILYNIKLYSVDAFAWSVIMIPMLSLGALWFLVLLRISVGALTSFYQLQLTQIEALIHYTVADISFIIAFWFLGAYLDHGHTGEIETLIATKELRISIGLLLLGAISIAVAFIIDVQAYLEIQVYRLGAARPVELIRGPHGGWEIDSNKNYHSYLILGEIEINEQLKEADDIIRREKPISRSFLIGCCVSTVELMGRRYSIYDDGDDDNNHRDLNRFGSFHSYLGSFFGSISQSKDDGDHSISEHSASHNHRYARYGSDSSREDLLDEDVMVDEDDIAQLLYSLEDGPT